MRRLVSDGGGHLVANDTVKEAADQRNRRARMRDLPAHHQHQQEAKKQKRQCRDAVLDADDLMVGGKDVRAPEPRIFMMLCMDSGMWNCVCRLHVFNQLLAQHLLSDRCQTRVSELYSTTRVNGGLFVTQLNKLNC